MFENYAVPTLQSHSATLYRKCSFDRRIAQSDNQVRLVELLSLSTGDRVDAARIEKAVKQGTLFDSCHCHNHDISQDSDASSAGRYAGARCRTVGRTCQPQLATPCW